MKKVICFLVFLVLACGCHNNRLKTDEKSLAKQILTAEEQLAQEVARSNRQLADSLAKLPKGFRSREDRKADPQNPPVTIDIIGNKTTPAKIRLSQFFDRIRYIRLENDPDSVILKSGCIPGLT